MPADHVRATQAEGPQAEDPVAEDPQAEDPQAEDPVAERIGRVIMSADGTGALDPDSPGDHLAIVARAAGAERATRDLLQQAVGAARGSGHSWAAIGGELGLSRQAVQQRFGERSTGREQDTDADPRHRWLGPVTAFDEMPELQLAGRLGWHTVGAGMLKHKMVHTETQWEHKRVVWGGSLPRLEAQGWRVGCRAFPWIYLIRDLGIPPEPGSSDRTTHP